MTTRYRNLWSVVRQIILEKHEVYESEYLRDVFYMIGDVLGEKLKNGEITQEEYDWYNSKQGSATLRDDVWTDMEQKHGLTRPKAWTYGVVFDNGVEHSLNELRRDMERDITYVWDQARGFIFVEKGGVAAKLKPLSEYGWTIFACKGYPERLLRKLLKKEEKKRPVLVLHDWDQDGKKILESMKFKTRRTRHLNIALEQRVTELGLTKDDVERLKLPTRPSPPKYKGIPRVEISALAVLKTRMELENPILTFVVCKMLAMDITLSPLEIGKREMLARHLRWALTSGLSNLVSKVVEEFIRGLEGEEVIEGKAVDGVLQKSDIIADEVADALTLTAQNLTDNLRWRNEDSWHEEAVTKFSHPKLVDLLSK